jgi:hypothetical protein
MSENNHLYVISCTSESVFPCHRKDVRTKLLFLFELKLETFPFFNKIRTNFQGRS